jgi:uncharacterized Tic20 family protein
MAAITMNEFSTNAQNRLVDLDASASERNWSMWMHLSLLAYPVTMGLVFVAPLVMWLTRKDDSPFIDDHGKETINFHVSLFLYSLIFTGLGFLTCGVAWGLIPGIYILGIVGMILAAKAAHRGEYYRYPMSLRLIH